MPRDTYIPTPEQPGATAPQGAQRLPSARLGAVLATAMLAIGVAAGAAIGPAPDASFAGGPALIAQRLPAVIAALAAKHAVAQTPAPSAAIAPTAPATLQIPRRTRRRRVRRAASAIAPAASTPASGSAPASGEEEAVGSSPSTPAARQKTAKLPPTTSVWLIELAGGTFAQALADPAAAPYITGKLIPTATYLGGWSALSASALASDAALAEPTPAGATPPLLRSIVQPPCPEGAAGAACAPETAGELTAADEFLSVTLAQITSTAAYREHGLVVITFANVAVATQAGLAAGASSATLTSQPPAGVVLLSPFAPAGAKPTLVFNTTSPRQSLEKLLR
jgi:hypothetical protein